MPFPRNPRVSAIGEPPIAEIRGWIADLDLSAGPRLLDAARAAPDHGPDEGMLAHLTAILPRPETALYTEILGLPTLRAAFAAHLSRAYGAAVAPAEVAITGGGNQAFAIALTAIAAPGDEVLVPLPFFWNHEQYIRMAGAEPVFLPMDPRSPGLPAPEVVATHIGPRTRALVVVSPNNPTGASCPPEALLALFRLARARGIALILDETYRDFAPVLPPHALFSEPGWGETLVHVYSFSKVFGLTGYRVGALAASPSFLAEAEKVMDCIAICAPRLGQEAVLHGLRGYEPRTSPHRARILGRLARLVERARTRLAPAGWRIASSGAFFLYAAHPFDAPAAAVARRLARDARILCLPGTAFGAADQERYLRFAVAALGEDDIEALIERLHDATTRISSSIRTAASSS